MNLEYYFENYSPDNFALNPNIVNRIINNSPVTLTYEDIAYNKMKSKIAELFNIVQEKSNEDNIIMKQISEKFIKSLLFCFVIIYLLSNKLNILSYENKDTKERKPRLYRIIIISIIITLLSFFFFYKNK